MFEIAIKTQIYSLMPPLEKKTNSFRDRIDFDALLVSNKIKSNRLLCI